MTIKLHAISSQEQKVIDSGLSPSLLDCNSPRIEMYPKNIWLEILVDGGADLWY